MAPSDVARAYIYRLCSEIGVSADSIYNSRTSAWYFSSGASTIELFLTTTASGQENERTFVRCFSPICAIPGDVKKKQALYEIALEINSDKMGIKLGALSDKGLLCAVSERDIDGMDYNEFISIVQDIGYWSDHLKNFFKTHYGS